MSRSNIYEETISVLEKNLERINIEWIGRKDGSETMTFEEFQQQASEFTYDNGYGSEVIPPDLVVVGPDWWLERHEYDGAEWWEFKRMPVRQLDAKPYMFFAQ